MLKAEGAIKFLMLGLTNPLYFESSKEQKLGFVSTQNVARLL